MNEQERMTKRLARIEPELEQANKHIEKLGAENQALRASWLDAEDSHGNAVKELTQLRAENEALKAERDWLVANLYSNELAKYQAKFGANAHQPWQYTEPAAPTAQAASEVPSAPQAAEIVNIDDSESEWLAWHMDSKGLIVRTKLSPVPQRYQHLVIFDHDYYGLSKYRLADKYDTAINRQVIKRHMQELGLEA